MISIGALVEGTSGVEYCLVVSSSPGMVSIGIIGVDLGVAIPFFTVGLGSCVVRFGSNKIDQIIYNEVVCSLT